MQGPSRYMWVLVGSERRAFLEADAAVKAARRLNAGLGCCELPRSSASCGQGSSSAPPAGEWALWLCVWLVYLENLQIPLEE